jgi:CRISPR-associated protein Csb2
MLCGYRKYAGTVEQALRWLEIQSPPLVRACPAVKRESYQIPARDNDMDVIAKDWLRGGVGEISKIRKLKPIHPKELRPEGPHVEYVWEVDSSEGAQMAEPLRIAARCLHTLGWGVDMAFADVGDSADLPDLYEPSHAGQPLAVTMPGTLDDLYRTYDRFTKRAVGTGADTYTRPTMLRMQNYRLAGDVIRPCARFMLMKPDIDQTLAVAWEDCMKVAGWLRHAAAESLKKEECPAGFIEAYVQGHTAEQDENQRLSYVPLPTIYKNNDGMIRRALILAPPGGEDDTVRLLQRKLTGSILEGSNGKECCLAPAPKNDYIFGCYLPFNGAKVWRSVTPVVLHGFNTTGTGRISLKKTEQLLLRAFEMAGYSEQTIEELAFQTGPWWPGTKHSSAMRVPQHLRRFPRLHVQVRFKSAMHGAVLAGIGRHYGIGLFAQMA